jgi:heme oxygenase
MNITPQDQINIYKDFLKTGREIEIEVMKLRMRKLKEELDEFFEEDDKSLEAMDENRDDKEYIRYLEHQQSILRMMINIFIEQFI